MSLTVSLSPLASEFIQSQIDSGEYADAQAVIEAALLDRQSRVYTTERWIIEQVLPTWEASKADPSRLIGIDQAFANLRDRLQNRAKVPSV